jgi:hypothetical protein
MMKPCEKCGCEMTLRDDGTKVHSGKHWMESDAGFCLERQLTNARCLAAQLVQAGDRMLDALKECGPEAVLGPLSKHWLQLKDDATLEAGRAAKAERANQRLRAAWNACDVKRVTL